MLNWRSSNCKASVKPSSAHLLEQYKLYKRNGEPAYHRGGIDDHAFPSLFEIGNKFPGEIHHPKDINLKLMQNLFLRRFFKSAYGTVARIIK